MAKKTVAQMRTEAREALMKRLMQYLINEDEIALVYDGNAFCIPLVFEDGTESWGQIKVSIPTGTRDGKQFDGFKENENYLFEQEQKRIEAEERAAERAKQTAERKAKQEAAKKKREEAEAERKAKREGRTAVE